MGLSLMALSLCERGEPGSWKERAWVGVYFAVLLLEQGHWRNCGTCLLDNPSTGLL